MIELSGVYKKTGADYALTNISFKAAKGEPYAVLGRRFSGKTALADVMTGCRYASHGSVIINGCDMRRRPLEAKRAVGYLPQRPSVYPEMTADEYMAFICSLKNVPGKDAKQSIEEALEQAGAAGLRGQLLRNAGREEQQRISLAGALCGSPSALILDEPTAGLDPESTEAFRETITSLKGTYTIVLLTRSIHEAVNVCDNVIVLRNGAIAARQTAQSLKKAAGEQRRLTVRMKTSRQAGLELLKNIEGIEYTEPLGSGENGACDFSVQSDTDVREQIFCAAAKANIVLLGLACMSVTLDDIFTELTGGDHQ